jgi:uncharacterized protein (DUF111 family)
MHHDDIRRAELLQELPMLLATAQQLGQGLANTSHGAMYRHAHEIIELLHQARLKLDQIQVESEGATGQDVVAEEVVIRETRVSVQFAPRFF